MIFSPELTFVPAKAPYHFTSKEKADEMVLSINRKIINFGPLSMSAKVDPFHLEKPGFADSATSWCIEVTPLLFHFDSEWLSPESVSHVLFMDAIRILFDTLKKDFGLVPSVTKRRKGVTKTYPTGGCHIHVEADMFSAGVDWYKKMERFHTNLLVDFANKPFIRWLLAEWSDNHNSSCLLTAKDLQKNVACHTVAEIFEIGVDQTNSIVPRFMPSIKNTYPTFEIRFINMVESAEELRAVATIIDCWVNWVAFDSHLRLIVPDLNGKQFQFMSTVAGAKQVTKEWLHDIGVPDDVKDMALSVFMERNYLRRIKFGRML